MKPIILVFALLTLLVGCSGKAPDATPPDLSAPEDPFTVTGGDGTLTAYAVELDADVCTPIRDLQDRADSLSPALFALADFVYDEAGNLAGETNLRLALFDAATRTFSSVVELEESVLPRFHSYTETGEYLIYCATDMDETKRPVWLVTEKDGALTLTRTEGNWDRSIVAYRTSPDGEWVAYREMDRHGHGGTYIRRADSTERTLIHSCDPALNTDGSDHVCTPLGFLSDGRLVYEIERNGLRIGYGIYDVTDADRIEYTGGDPDRIEFIRDDVLYGCKIYTAPVHFRVTAEGAREIYAAEDTLEHPILVNIFRPNNMSASVNHTHTADGLLSMVCGENGGYTHAYVFSRDLAALRLALTVDGEMPKGVTPILTEDSLIFLCPRSRTN